MSEQSKKTPLITTVGESTEQTSQSPVKQSFWQKKVVTPIKTHPKIAAAVVGGVALVTGAAFLGRKTAPTSEPEIYLSLPSPVVVEDEEILTEPEDTTVA